MDLACRLRAFRNVDPAVKEYPSIPLKKAKLVLLIQRYSFLSATSRVDSEDCYIPALNNMFQLYNLARESMRVATYDV